MGDIIEDLLGLLAGAGSVRHAGDPVTLREHARQCAWRAVRAGAPGPLVAAALLHDIGHVLASASGGLDGGQAHEAMAANFLSPVLPPAVVRPIALHVEAKRWLCRRDPAYAARLSPAAASRMVRQGGAMTAAEAAVLEADPHGAAAIRLRRWDEAAKVPGLVVPPLDVYWPLLRTLADRRECSAA